MSTQEQFIVAATLAVGYWVVIVVTIRRWQAEQRRHQQELFNKARGGMKL